MKKRILIMGSGAREYALGRKFREDTRVGDIYFCPGNGGTQSFGINVNHSDHQELVAFALEKKIDLIVIGATQPLVEGLSDLCESAGLKVFGPSQQASLLESSKSFAKEIAQLHNVPLAPFKILTSPNLNQLQDLHYPLVFKADSLCMDGVVIAQDENASMAALDHFFNKREQKKVVVETYLEGMELSLFALVHHENYLLLPPCQTYKQLSGGGPTTEGMGAFAPAGMCDTTLQRKIATRVIEPILKAMKDMGRPLVGVLYAGIMAIQEEGTLEPYLLEYNVRFGDPECSVLLPLIKTPLFDLFQATLEGNLQELSLELHPQYCLGVVLASKDYPYQMSEGQSVYIDPMDEKNGHLDLGEIAQENGVFSVSGGRVGACVGVGKSLLEAREHAYHLVHKVQFEGMQFREDIGS
ncbi:phosphoribosylamine--glycine ligase [Helicobacter felis]|uniref:phosphoribosylamine--glycine ligase n=1 Tax=Helicobacter felis TaxID=214 RepID=UPI000CEF1EAC|nr:phosphoribosylamine--glycine ligase [Helicobacter felis]